MSVLCMALKGQKWITQRYVWFQQYIFTEIQTVTGNWLNLLGSFIESVTIYRDVMRYIIIREYKLHPVTKLRLFLASGRQEK